MRAALAVCIGYAFLLGAVSAQTKYTLRANNTCGTSYFDTTSYECLPCGMTGAVATGSLCACPSGYVASPSDSSCIACPTGYSNSFANPRTCLSCNVSSFAFSAVQGIYNNATYDAATRACSCPDGMYLTERTRAGDAAQLVGSFSCVACPDNYATSADRRACVPCRDPLMRRSAAGICSCEAAGYSNDGYGNCLIQAALTAVSDKYNKAAVGKLTFYNVMNGDGTTRDSVPVLTSSLFLSLFPSAASGCSRLSSSVKGNLDPSPCHSLANLCMLAQFDAAHPACLALKEYAAGAQGLTNGFRDWGARYPWIQYAETASTVLASDSITVPISFRGPNSTLNFTLATFAANGSFLGLSKLSNQLHLCAGQQSDLTKFLQVGYSQDVQCSVSLAALAAKDGFAYELFVNDVNGLMYPVPVVVTTLRSGTAQPNQLFNLEGASTSTVLTRRFFLADTQSGRSSDSKQSVVQYASKVVLRISTRPTSPISIYPPLLLISYSSYDAQFPDFPAAFSSEYTMDTLAFSDLQRSVLVIIVGVIIAAHSILKTFNIMRIHQNQALTGREYLNVVGSILGCISDWLFLWIFLVCLYLFIFFKTQLEAHVLMPLPSSGLQKSLVQCINCAGALKVPSPPPHPPLQVFQVALIIYRSTNMDIFFIDWEKPAGPVKVEGDIPDVSTWRSLFATNEWNELLSYRRCSLEFTLILIMWLFSGQGWIYVATSRPNQFDLSAGALSVPLEFFFVLLLFYSSSLLQYFARVFIRERFIRCCTPPPLPPTSLLPPPAPPPPSLTPPQRPYQPVRVAPLPVQHLRPRPHRPLLRLLHPRPQVRAP